MVLLLLRTEAIALGGCAISSPTSPTDSQTCGAGGARVSPRRSSDVCYIVFSVLFRVRSIFSIVPHDVLGGAPAAGRPRRAASNSSYCTFFNTCCYYYYYYINF